MTNPNQAPTVTAEQEYEWRERECRRFRTEEYTRLPASWLCSDWICKRTPDGICPNADHYAHVSIKDAALVAFTESPAKGVADRQMVMRPGKYLTKYYGHCLTALEITELATKFAAEFNPCALRFAETADEIEEVYTHERERFSQVPA